MVMMMMMITEIMLLRKSFGRRLPHYVVVIIVSERTSSTSLLRPEWVYRLLSSLVTWRTRSTQRRGGSIISSSRRWLRSLLQSLFSSMGLQQAREEVTPGFSFFSPLMDCPPQQQERLRAFLLRGFRDCLFRIPIFSLSLAAPSSVFRLFNSSSFPIHALFIII